MSTVDDGTEETMMKTTDGWEVTAVELEPGGHFFRVTYLGKLMGGATNFKGRGLVRTTEQVHAIMGDSFVQLLQGETL